MGPAAVLSQTGRAGFETRARRIRWLLSDVDGVLTDGRLHYGPAGEERKVFNVKDGLAVKLARRAALDVGLLSARASAALERRAAELGLEEVVTGREDKAIALAELLERRRLEPEAVAYLGDDLGDLPVIARVGLSFAPRDAAAEVRERVDRVLESAGGGGALRETVELLLKARDEWDAIVGRYAAG